jgi:CDP-diacylglycerol--glycerol-3-phosphate 3-phosphatidyltransferase
LHWLEWRKRAHPERIVIKSTFGERLDAFIHRAFPFLFVGRLDPNMLTVCGALVSLGAAVAFAQGRLGWAGFLILFGGFFDLVDGVVARHHGISTRFGAFLDSTLDRFVDCVLLVGISVYYAGKGDAGVVALAGATLVSIVLVSYSKARAELVVEEFEVGLLERGERIGILAAAAVFDFIEVALWIILVGSVITVWQRFALAYREMERLDLADRNPDVPEDRPIEIGGPNP